MSTVPDPYQKVSPGDLITAQLFNGLQYKIKSDIADQIKHAIDDIPKVKLAADSEKLGGKTPEKLEEEIIQRALSAIPKRTGYRMIFKRLQKGREKVIEHQLKACPLVDIYQLDYFPVICATGDTKDDRTEARVNFYLYHSNENKFKSIAPAGKTFEIEPTDGVHRPFRIPFKTMLDLFKVPYTDTSSLDDLETEFWKALFADPNDEFDNDQYCHSPWFEKCCGEKRSVATLNSRGDWNDIVFQMRPRKVVHFPSAPPPAAAPPLNPLQMAFADVQVVHFDFDTIGVELLNDPSYPDPLTPPAPPPIPLKQELKVMLLLKV
jgi:hypothetical protein